MKNGSFNWCFKVEFNDGTKWAVRFPVAGKVIYAEKKVRREVAIMRFLRERTQVPVPKVIAFGMAADNHDTAMGPFIIEEWIDGIPLSTVMEELHRPSWGPVLRGDISDDFRPGNILFQGRHFRNTCVMDWEWTYAGPYQFLFSPPPWVILENPPSWTTFSESLYQTKFLLLLKSLEYEEVEREKDTAKEIPLDQKLSVLMR